VRRSDGSSMLDSVGQAFLQFSCMERLGKSWTAAPHVYGQDGDWKFVYMCRIMCLLQSPDSSRIRLEQQFILHTNAMVPQTLYIFSNKWMGWARHRCLSALRLYSVGSFWYGKCLARSSLPESYVTNFPNMRCLAWAKHGLLWPLINDQLLPII